MLVYVEETAKRQGRFRAELADGTLLVRSSRQPLLDSARQLLSEGIDPETELVMARRVTREHSLRGKVGALAKLTVEDADHGRVRFRAYTADWWRLPPG